MRTLRIAFGLLTTFPIKLPEDWSVGDSGRAAVWYSFIGLIIGGITWLAWKVAMLVLPTSVAGVIVLIVWIVLTGGLHLDGLADCCDGLLASATPERRLEIMKDPRLGAFGVIGLTLILLLKAVMLGTLTSSTSLGIVLAASLSRWLILPVALFPLARTGGMGVDFSSGLRRSSVYISGLLPFGLAIALGVRGIFSLVAGFITIGLILLFTKKRIGGVTGDVFGLVVEVVEAIVLLVFSIKAL
jgi:adenosylcobinamide-GDP ribazoletransferase